MIRLLLLPAVSAGEGEGHDGFPSFGSARSGVLPFEPARSPRRCVRQVCRKLRIRLDDHAGSTSSRRRTSTATPLPSPSLNMSLKRAPTATSSALYEVRVCTSCENVSSVP